MTMQLQGRYIHSYGHFKGYWCKARLTQVNARPTQFARVQEQVIGLDYGQLLEQEQYKSGLQVEQQKADTKKVGTILGAVGLVTGSSVGAGILALPSVASEAGYLPTISVLAVSWLVLTTEALLIAEINVKMRQSQQQRVDQDSNDQSSQFISIPDMAAQTLGPAGGSVAKLIYTFLASTLLIAYTSKAGDVVETVTQGKILGQQGSLLFDMLVAACLLGNVTSRTEAISRKVTTAMLLLFALFCGVGIPTLDLPSVSAYVDMSQLPTVFPVLFLSLVYHDLVPVLCDYLGGDARRIRTAIIVGGVIPPVLFAFFCAVALSMVAGMHIDLHTVGSDLLDPLRVITQASPLAKLVVPLFCLTAVFTSCTGCSMGFSKFVGKELEGVGAALPGSFRSAVATAGARGLEAGKSVMEALQRKRESPIQNDHKEPLLAEAAAVSRAVANGNADKAGSDGDLPVAHTLALALIFVPVLTISQTYPELFFRATQLAGGYGMTLLYGVLPPIMAAKLRYGQSAQRAPQRTGTLVYRGGSSLVGQAAGTVRVSRQPSMAREGELVPGGKVVLGGLVAAAVGLVGNQVMLDSGLAAQLFARPIIEAEVSVQGTLATYEGDAAAPAPELI